MQVATQRKREGIGVPWTIFYELSMLGKLRLPNLIKPRLVLAFVGDERRKWAPLSYMKMADASQK